MWNQLKNKYPELFYEFEPDQLMIRKASYEIHMSNESDNTLGTDGFEKPQNGNCSQLEDWEKLYKKLREIKDEIRLNFLKDVIILDDYYVHLHNIGDICITLRRYDEAKDAYNRARSLDGNNFRHHHGLGRAYYCCGQYIEAIECFITTLSLFPNYIDALTNLSISYYALGQYDTALSVIKKTLELMGGDKPPTNFLPMTPDNFLKTKSKLYAYVADIYIKRGDYEQAEKAEENCKNALIFSKPDINTLFTHDFDLAYMRFQIKMLFNNDFALGLMYLRNGSFDEALGLCNEILNICNTILNNNNDAIKVEYEAIKAECFNFMGCIYMQKKFKVSDDEKDYIFNQSIDFFKKSINTMDTIIENSNEIDNNEVKKANLIRSLVFKYNYILFYSLNDMWSEAICILKLCIENMYKNKFIMEENYPKLRIAFGRVGHGLNL